jgi:hypothetical protein
MPEKTTTIDEVRTRRLVIEDKDGVGKIVLMTTPEGDPAIGLFDRNGVVRLQLLILDGDAPKVLLTDSQGNGRLQIGVDAKDSAGMAIFHDNDRPWLLFTTDGHRNYLMCLFDRDEEMKPTWVGQVAP